MAGSAAISDTLLEGGCPASGASCSGTILTADPQFVTPVPAPAPSTGGDLHLRRSSPALNAGNNAVTNPPLPATDRDGNPRVAEGTVDLGAYETFPDTTPPTVTIEQANGQADPTASGPISFTVVFSEPVSGFTSADVTLGGTAGATTATVSGSGATYTVAVSGMTASGTVSASIPAGAATDAAGNANTASTSADNTVTFLPRRSVYLPLLVR